MVSRVYFLCLQIPLFHYSLIFEIIKRITYEGALLGGIAAVLKSGYHLIKWYQKIFSNKQIVSRLYSEMAVKVVDMLLHFYSFYITVKSWLSLQRNLYHSMAQAFLPQQHWMCMVQKVYTALQEDPELWTLCQPLVPRTQAMVMQKGRNEPIHELFHLLTSQDLARYSTFFSMTGRLVKSFFVFQKHHKALHPIWYEIGFVESLLNLAEAYEQLKDKEHRLCFVTFTEGSKPHLEFQALWNSSLPSEKVVSNTLSLQGSLYHTSVLGGPNANGKTTHLRALRTVLLAQSYGLACAQKACLSPFHYIASFLDVKQEMGTLSQYTAELQRIIDILKALEQRDPEKPSLILMDEPIKGTDQERYGPAVAYGIIRYITLHFPQSALFVITHHEQIQKMIEAYPQLSGHQAIHNFHGKIIRLPDGRIKLTFKIEKGLSPRKDRVGIDIAEQGGYLPQEVIDDARRRVKRTKS